jgi:SsfX3, N-terminal domain
VNALISAPITADLLRGALELETTAVGVLPHRLPARARALADPQLLAAEACPAGVRLVFRTAATVVEIDNFRTTMAFRDMPPRPDGRYDLLVDGVLTGRQCSSGGRTVVIDLATGATETRDVDLVNLGFSGSMMLDPFVARTIRDLPADLLSVEVGINIVAATSCGGGRSRLPCTGSSTPCATAIRPRR